VLSAALKNELSLDLVTERVEVWWLSLSKPGSFVSRQKNKFLLMEKEGNVPWEQLN